MAYRGQSVSFASPPRFRVVLRMRDDFAAALCKSDSGKQIVELDGRRTRVEFFRTKAAALKLARAEGEIDHERWPGQKLAMSHVIVCDDERGCAQIYRSPGCPEKL